MAVCSQRGSGVRVTIGDKRRLGPVRSRRGAVNAAFLIAAYIVKKIGFYCAMLSNKFDAQWIRTDRGKPK
jgi:hypothetical protein